MKIISTLLLLGFLVMVGTYSISDRVVFSPVTEDEKLKENSFNKGKSLTSTLMPDSQKKVSPLAIPETIDASSSDADNPYLPVAYSAKQHDSKLAENDKAVHITLEEGQSRRFLYSSSHDDAGVPSEFVNAGEGYFLQPGQSRTFLPLSDKQNIPAEDE